MSSIRKILAYIITNDLKPICEQIVVGLSGFLAIVFLGRYSTSTELGIYSMVFGLIMFLRAIPDTLTFAAYSVRSQSIRLTQKSKYAFSTIILVLFLSVILACTIYSFSLLLQSNKYSHITESLQAASLICIFIYLKDFARHHSYAHNLLNTAFIISITTTGLQFIGYIYLISKYQLTSRTALYSMGISCLIVTVTWIFFSLRRIEINKLPAIYQDWRKNWHFGKWLLLSSTTGTFSNYFMPWIVSYYHTPSLTGKLAICTSIAGLANHIMVGLSNIITPRVSKAYANYGKHQLLESLKTSLYTIMITVGGCALVLAYSGQAINDYLYELRYPDMGIPISILAISVLVSALGMLFGNGILALNKNKYIFYADLSKMLSSLFSAFLLVPNYGLRGCVFAIFVGASVGTLVSFFSFRFCLRDA